MTAAEDGTNLKNEHVKAVQKVGERMKKAIWPVFWALVGDFLVLAVNFIPAVGKWTLTYMAFYPLVGVLFFVLGIALLVLTLKGMAAGLLRTFLLMTGAAPIAIPIGFVFLEAVPETIANCILYVVLLAFLTGIIGSIVLSRRQPKEATSHQCLR
ncbi:MAG: hypothetical protein A2Z74_02705 [Chloroflexi bacterium RBG_13_46_9]|nr:MAG: hypothetical protein A2Z74_02705 [Chloroflexi bacterium RBG_13_46_9]